MQGEKLGKGWGMEGLDWRKVRAGWGEETLDRSIKLEKGWGGEVEGWTWEKLGTV